jgi:hypothetical protein
MNGQVAWRFFAAGAIIRPIAMNIVPAIFQPDDPSDRDHPDRRAIARLPDSSRAIRRGDTG